MAELSDRALRVVVAAARAGSLSRAAVDLDMSQAAVSQAVRRAEDAVGAELLERSRTGVRPTAIGTELLEAVGPAYDTIDDAVRTSRQVTADPTVSISVSTSFATWWLLPRLPDFKRRHPDVALRLVTTDTDRGVDVSELDLWIPLGLVERDDLDAVPLCPEALVPVADPTLAASRDVWSPATIAEGPLLHLEERYRPRFDWPTWFSRHDIELGSIPPGDRTTDYSLVLYSALGGQGLALGWVHLVSDLIADGRLVALAEPVTTDQPFMILNRADRPLPEPAVHFRRWLVDTMRQSLSVSH